MNAQAIQGRYVVFAAIGVTVAHTVMMSSLPLGGLRSAGVALILLSLTVYDGQTWARWTLGIALATLGALWTLQSATLGADSGVPGFMVVLVVLAFASLAAGLALLFSRVVRAFVAQRKLDRNPAVHKTLVAFWLLVAALLAIAVVLEVAGSSRAGAAHSTFKNRSNQSIISACTWSTDSRAR